MTTFTPSSISNSKIWVGKESRLSPINRNIYGGFAEHVGRCIYGGIYDPGNSLSDENGFRKDVIKALKELEVPVIRWPGGNFVETYHWMDGIGPKDKRPARYFQAYQGYESNQFGTDDFMKWCSLVGCAPYLCFNFGTGTLDEALNWVEYCNGTNDTYYANLRRANGHPEPYGVKYWGLGNELWGDFQVQQTTKEEYAARAHQWAKALKRIDSSIELVLCGMTGLTRWDQWVLNEASQFISMHSIHIYTSSPHHLGNVIKPLVGERAIQTASAMVDISRIEHGHPHRPSICFDEWNVWDSNRAPGEEGAEESYSLSDALAVGVWLNVFVRQSKHLGMCNLAQSVNVISPLMTSPEGIRRQATWWPLLLFSRYMRGHTLGVHHTGGAFEGNTEPGWLRGTMETPWLDVSASLDDHGWISLAVVNLNPKEDVKTEIVSGFGKAKVQVYTVNGPDDELMARPALSVGVQEGEWDGKGKYCFPKHSFTMLRWRGE